MDQEATGELREVAGRYVRAGWNEVRFAATPYDSRLMVTRPRSGLEADTRMSVTSATG